MKYWERLFLVKLSMFYHIVYMLGMALVISKSLYITSLAITAC